MSSVTYKVTGMTCEHCARAVTSEIEALGGVSAVAVDLIPGGVSAVTVTSQAPLPADAVAAALDEAGDYRLASDYRPSGDYRLASDARPSGEADRGGSADGPQQAPAGRSLPLL